MGETRDPAIPDGGGLLGLLLETQQVDTFLREITAKAVAEIDPRFAAGLTTRQQGRYVTVARTHPRASQVDELQYRQRSGPCLDALNHGRAVLVETMCEDDRWGDFRWHAVAHEVASSLSTPITVGGRTVAALNVYAPVAGAFDAEKCTAIARFAEAAATAIAVALRLAQQEKLTEQLQQALTSRAVIAQALGIIMSGQRCDADEAFEILRNASQAQNVKVRAIAEQLIQAVTGKPPVLPPDLGG